MTGPDHDVSFEFGAFRLLVREHQLLRDGEQILLTPKAFETLVALVERAGRVVTKEELMRIVWPDSFVEESGLTRNVSVLRKVLGSSESGGFIETVPKVGYRFTLPVKRVAADDDADRPDGSADALPASAIGKYIWASVIVAVFAAAIFYYAFRPGATPLNDDPKSIAVLPFKPISTQASDPALEIGVADTLITRLSGIKKLSVKPTSVIRSFTGADVDSVAAGRELGVDAVLEGSIQRDADRLRVSVRLVRVGDGKALWAQNFDEPTADIFAVQDVIAQKVASAMQIRVDAAEQERMLRRYTNNVEAFDLYLNGRSQLLEYTRQATLSAIDSFEAALKVEPEYALARAGLATACAEMYLRFASESEAKVWAERADSEIEQALELEPELAETHQALAAIYRKKDFNWEKVLYESDRALELNPGLDQPHFFRAAALYHLGFLDEAGKEVDTAERINPRSRVDGLRARGVIALYAERYADAIASFQEVQKLSSKPIADSHLAQAYFYQGDVERAIELSREMSSDQSASASSRAQASLASFLAAAGDVKAARQLLETLVRKDYLDHHAAYSIGAAFAQLRDPGNAMVWLRRAASTGLPCYPLYKRDKLLDPIRDKPEFRTFLVELQRIHDSGPPRR